MWIVGFLLMFFGLLAAGMPIFLVLGACAAILYFMSDQPMIGQIGRASWGERV